MTPTTRLGHLPITLDALGVIDTYITVTITKTIGHNLCSWSPRHDLSPIQPSWTCYAWLQRNSVYLVQKIWSFHRKLSRPWMNVFESGIFKASEGSVTISSLTCTIPFLLFTITSWTTCHECMFIYFYFLPCITRMLHASDACLDLRQYFGCTKAFL